MKVCFSFCDASFVFLVSDKVLGAVGCSTLYGEDSAAGGSELWEWSYNTWCVEALRSRTGR